LHYGREPGNESLEAALVVVIERIELFGIYVENGDQITLRIPYGNHDLGTGSSVASYMAGKFLDIRNDHRLHFRCSGAAYSATKSDLETSQRALVWPDAKQCPRLYDSIKPGPQMPEGMMNERGYRGHRGNRVSNTIEDRFGVRLELAVSPGLWNTSQVGNRFCHQ
jgi:hypothetical protein